MIHEISDREHRKHCFVSSPGIYAWVGGWPTMFSPLPGGLPVRRDRSPLKGAENNMAITFPGVNAWARENEGSRWLLRFMNNPEEEPFFPMAECYNPRRLRSKSIRRLERFHKWCRPSEP